MIIKPNREDTTREALLVGKIAQRGLASKPIRKIKGPTREKSRAQLMSNGWFLEKVAYTKLAHACVNYILHSSVIVSSACFYSARVRVT
jgi:hypothetical protein